MNNYDALVKIKPMTAKKKIKRNAANWTFCEAINIRPIIMLFPRQESNRGKKHTSCRFLLNT